MKKLLAVLVIVLTATIVMALTTKDTQDNISVSYATIAYSTASKNIYVYYGSQVPREEIAVKKSENVNDQLVDILSDLSKKGFEVISSNTHAFNVNFNKDQSVASASGNFIEFYYTLRKK